MLEIGKVRGTKIPAYLDLNTIAKGHMFIARMTRSGKSSFVVNLVAKAAQLKPRPRFIVFDKRGEYRGLTKYGSTIFAYDKFTPTITDPEAVTSRLELKGREKDAVLEAVRSLISEGTKLTRDTVLAEVEKVLARGIVYKTSESQAKSLESIRWILKNRGAFLDEATEPADIIETVKSHPTIIIDYSTDTDIEAQQRTACHIVNRIREYAMERKDIGDFACIIAIEEAQYLAPERGLEVKETSAQDEAKASLIETISQAGGYNVGLILMTQRPAYVLKSCISQCNTVACFRLKSGNDQDAILMYTEYGSERLRDYLPGLADHEAMLWGTAVPTPFPVIAEIDICEYPQKAAVFAKQAWQKMET